MELVLKKKEEQGFKNRASNNKHKDAKHKINKYISAPIVRVITDEGGNDEMQLQDAIALADSLQTDLVQITEGNVPVCKLIDYDKYLYQLDKKSKNKGQAKKQKQVKFHPRIASNDLHHKLDHIKGFIEEGHRVEIICQFAGRERTHKEFGRELFDRILVELNNVAKIDGSVKDGGNNILMYIIKK